MIILGVWAFLLSSTFPPPSDGSWYGASQAEIRWWAQFALGWILYGRGLGRTCPSLCNNIPYVVAVITLPTAYAYLSKLEDEDVKSVLVFYRLLFDGGRDSGPRCNSVGVPAAGEAWTQEWCPNGCQCLCSTPHSNRSVWCRYAAVILLLHEKRRIVEATERDALQRQSGFPEPLVIWLTRYVRLPHRLRQPPVWVRHAGCARLRLSILRRHAVALRADR